MEFILIVAVIIILVIISIIRVIFKWLSDLVGWLSDLVGGPGRLIVTIIILVVLSVFGLWPYALGFLAICIVGYIIVSLIAKAVKYVGDQVEKHDRSKKEIAQINQKTQQDKQIHSNDVALMEELSKNCCWLGFMSDEMWLKKLPNYANLQYSTDFRTITSNFAKQIEQQYILQNKDWFEPFKLYLVNNPGGSTVTKMLHEVDCPQLKMTHSTPDVALLNTWLMRGTKKANDDVPALFSERFIKEMNASHFTSTSYLKKLYGNNGGSSEKINHATEIDFDDL